MFVIGISGSPRAGGNSEVLLKHALAPFAEQGWSVSEFLLSERKVQPCRGCDRCAETGLCVIDDDMHILYDIYARCDALIVASPVYYRNVTAQLKAVFDRTYAVRGQNPLAGLLAEKVGGAISVGRGTGGGQSLALTAIHNFFLSSGLVCVPGELNGVSAVADAPGDVLMQPKRLRQARILGENVLRWAGWRDRIPGGG
ncbi:MAG: flavodoxin family protein [Anaerolineae bacterium]|nr:flavodoxin family protein [Anaerolineae bacterium]